MDGANRHDMKLFRQTLDSIPVTRPQPTAEQPQGMCLDKGYDYDEVREIADEFAFTKHIKSRGEEAEAIKKEAAKRGVVVTQLGADWQQLMRFTDDARLDEKQKAMIERAKASKATMGVKIMVAPPPAVLEHALTADAKAPAGSKDPARITVAFSDNSTITIVRTSIDLKPDVLPGIAKDNAARLLGLRPSTPEGTR